MALYDEGKRIEDYWSHDAKHVEAVFKVLAMSSGTAALVKVIAGPETIQHFPHFETWRAVFATFAGLYLLFLVFRYADAALVDTYHAYRQTKGRPISRARSAFVSVCIFGFGMVLPASFVMFGVKL